MIDKIKSYKLVILGDGATALVSQFCLNKFTETYDPTIENLYRKHILINGESCILEILDTAGQEEYVALRHQWIKDGDGFLLVYSVSSRSTFDRIKRFKEQIIEIKNTKSVPLVLVGNKSDRIFDREIPFEEGQSLANLFNCEFIETSAKSFTNVELAFYNLAKIIRKSKINNKNEIIKRKRKKKNSNNFSRFLYQKIKSFLTKN